MARRRICIILKGNQNNMMSILRSLVAAPLLICGTAICSPVSAETVINNDLTPVVSAAVKEALKKAESLERPSLPLVVNHSIDWGKIQRMGCKGSIRNNCKVWSEFQIK